MLEHPATECPIDTVVILMAENRSFDHMLGWLGTDQRYVEAGRRRWGHTFGVAARTDLLYADPHGTAVRTEPLVERDGDPNPFRLCKGPVPGHGWNAGRAQRDHGFLAAGTGNDENAIGYYRADDLPIHAAFARRFTVCDHHFASVLGPTFPNRHYFHSGESEGRKTDPGPLRRGIFDSTTIWDKLTAAGVACGCYYTDNPASFLVFGDRLRPLIRSLDRYFEDCAAGTLPNVVFLSPSFSGELRTDYHPRGCINVGERFLLSIAGAFMQSPQWHRGAFIHFYDEWGGFFDHVRPPTFPDERASSNDANNFGQAGFRVPSLLMSPYARQNYVDPTVYDHTSVLRFLEWRFLGAPAFGPGNGAARWSLTTRDRHANNYALSLRATRSTPEVDLTVEVPTPTAGCGNESDLVKLDTDGDPFVLSDELAGELHQFASPTATPWLST